MAYTFLPTILTLLFISFQLFSVGSLSSSSLPLHIFISFRGIDTRENIASLMQYELDRAGFNVFMDDQSIRTGHDIDLVIREAINNSMGAVIIFSRNFASSEWCLEELGLILDRKRDLGSGYVLQPIYVDGVDPDDIHEERGCYGDALAEYKKRYSYWNWIQKWKWHNKVNLWNAGLREVAGYRGRILSGKWAKFINEMVEDIRQEFIILGITVKPRPRYDQKSKGLMETVYELIQKLAIIGRFVYKNRWILDIFMRTSFGQPQDCCHVSAQVHAHTNKPTNKKLTGNKKNEMGVLEGRILNLILFTVLFLSACHLIRRKFRELVLDDSADDDGEAAQAVELCEGEAEASMQVGDRPASNPNNAKIYVQVGDRPGPVADRPAQNLKTVNLCTSG